MHKNWWYTLKYDGCLKEKKLCQWFDLQADLAISPHRIWNNNYEITTEKQTEDWKLGIR